MSVRSQSSVAVDERWMRQALDLARRGEGSTRPNPPVGAIVVRRGRRVGSGYHRQAGGAHAEVFALRVAGKRARGATLYVTLEPCSTQGRTPPCTKALIAAGVGRVVVAVRDPNPVHNGRGIRDLRRAGIRVTEGVCAVEARRLVAPFAKWMATGRPYVSLKIGMSLDGRIADFRGRSRWITSAPSRRAVRELRRKVDAIMVGRRTACLDDPSLLPDDKNGNLYRIVVDSIGHLRPTARVLNDGHAGQTVIATTRRCSRAVRGRYRAKGARVWELKSIGGRVFLKDLLREAGRAGLLHVLCEGGGTLAAGLITEKLVDEYLFFVAPRILGGSGAVPAVAGSGWRLDHAPRVVFVGHERVGDDILLRAVPRG